MGVLGTCEVTLTNNSMTLGGQYLSGANDFLNNSGSNLKMIGVVSLSGNASLAHKQEKARLLVSQIGQLENPVVAEYFRGSVSAGHFSAVRNYRNLWQGDVSVTVRTVDDYGSYDRLWALHGAWTLESGVFTLVNK